MLEHRIIEPSQSERASPWVLVKKYDETYCFCSDYQKVNAITKADLQPIPQIDDCIDRIGRAKYLTKFDLLKGYWAVPLTERAKKTSAFVILEGAYQYRVIPFGMWNSQATFGRLINADIPGVDTYIDYIVIHNDAWEKHIEAMAEIFRKLLAANLTSDVE